MLFRTQNILRKEFRERLLLLPKPYLPSFSSLNRQACKIIVDHKSDYFIPVVETHEYIIAKTNSKFSKVDEEHKDQNN